MPNTVLYKKILDEGYCCIHGYLTLCKARGEKTKNMAKFIGVAQTTVEYNLQQQAKNKRPCQGAKDCLLPIVAEIKGKSE